MVDDISTHHSFVFGVLVQILVAILLLIVLFVVVFLVVKHTFLEDVRLLSSENQFLLAVGVGATSNLALAELFVPFAQDCFVVVRSGVLKLFLWRVRFALVCCLLLPSFKDMLQVFEVVGRAWNWLGAFDHRLTFIHFFNGRLIVFEPCFDLFIVHLGHGLDCLGVYRRILGFFDWFG